MLKSNFLKKSLLVLSSVCILSAAAPYSVLASEVSTPEEKVIARQQYELSKKNNYIVPNDRIDELSLGEPQVSIMAENPGTGATRVNLVTYGWYGQPIVQDQKSGNFNLIKGTVIVILGPLLTTAGSVVLSVADLILSNVDTTQYATAKTMISYNYPTKQGQVYYSNAWHTLFESTNRNTYKHYYSIFIDSNKNSRQGTVDYVPANGYSAIKVESAPNYNNNSFIQNKAYQNYLQGKKYTDEDWTR